MSMSWRLSRAPNITAAGDGCCAAPMLERQAAAVAKSNRFNM
jgi:hypothetical protein